MDEMDSPDVPRSLGWSTFGSVEELRENRTRTPKKTTNHMTQEMEN